MSKKHNKKNYEAKNETVKEEVPVEETTAEEPVVEVTVDGETVIETTANEEPTVEKENVSDETVEEEEPAMEKPKIVEGEAVHDEHENKNDGRCKKKHGKKDKKFNGKKIMHVAKDVALNAAWIASTSIVICHCMTNPISSCSLLAKECIEYHFEREERKELKERVRNEVLEELRDAFKNVADVCPTA